MARDLVDHLYETALEPERLTDLIEAWDARLRDVDSEEAIELHRLAEQDVIPHITRALAIIDRINVAEAERVQGVLASIDGAALIVGSSGIVVAANPAAQIAHSLFPGDILAETSPDPIAAEIHQRLGALLARGAGAEAVVSLRLRSTDRLVVLHLRAIGSGRDRQVLAVTSECLWPDRVSHLLADAFDLTPAEITVLQSIAAGDTVSGIATRRQRSQYTVRTQVHALLAKTGARNQVELVRLCNLLLRSGTVALATIPEDDRRQILRRRSLTLPDGRRVDTFTFGDPRGVPVIWMQSTLGLFLPTRTIEEEMLRLGLRVVVPIRAGYGGSDPAPLGADPTELAIADLHAVLARLRIDCGLIVAPVDDLRLAFEFAWESPERVLGVVGLGAGLPIRTVAQYRRLHPLSRFFRVCARHTPHALPFAAKAFHAWIRRFGVEGVMRKTYTETPGDARAFARAEVVEVLTSGFNYLMGGPNTAETFCAELVRFHEDWPEALGRVRCPVLLIHGEDDHNSPIETVREYCAENPTWRLVSFPGEGQLLTYGRAPEVLDLIAGEVRSSGATAERLSQK